MNRRLRPLSFTARNWPSPIQLLLLRACLGDGAEAIAAWRAWQKRIEFDDIDLSSQRLVPLLHHNLTRLGVDDPCLGRYRGISRKCWYENQLLFQRTAATLELLHGAGIPTLVLKGVALAHLYYPGTALRPMSDFDIMVPLDRAEEALQLLVNAGWEGLVHSAYLRKPTPHVFQGGHSWNFNNPAGGHVDLHWRALKLNLAPGAEDNLWRGAEKFRFAHTETLTLNATDHLLHTCLHGLPKNNVPSMRWVADAIMILRSRVIDWDRLLAEMQVHRASVMMLYALTYLRDFFAAPVPDQVLERIRALPLETWEYHEFASMANNRRVAWRLQKWFYGFLRFRRTMPAAATRSLPGSYMRYWTMRWDIEHPKEIPAAAGRRMAGWVATFRERL
jgi:hypothetical protein